MSEETSFTENTAAEREQTQVQQEQEEEDGGLDQSILNVERIVDEDDKSETSLLEDDDLEKDIDLLVKRAKKEYPSQRKIEQGLIRKNRQITAKFIQEAMSSDKVEAPLFRASDGPYSKRILEGVRNVKFGERSSDPTKGSELVETKKQLLTFRYYGKPVSITLRGKINRKAIAINRGILDDFQKATEEYKSKLRSIPEKKFETTITPKEEEHTEMNVLADFNQRIEMEEKALEEKSSLRVITTNLGGTSEGEGTSSGVTIFSEKERNEMVSALDDDRNVDYDRLKEGDDLELQRFNSKIESYKNNIEYFRKKAITEQDPNRKHAYILTKNLNILKLSETEIKAGRIPNQNDLKGLTEKDKEKIIDDIKEALEKYSEHSVFSTRAKVWKFFKKYPGAITSAVLGVGSIAFAMFAYFQSGLSSAASDIRKFGKSMKSISEKANELGDKITEASKKEGVIEEGVKSIKKGYDSLKYYTGKLYKFLAFVLSILASIVYFVANALLYLSNNLFAFALLLISILYYYSNK